MGRNSSLQLFLPQFLFYSDWRPRLQDLIMTFHFESSGQALNLKRLLHLARHIHPFPKPDCELWQSERCGQMKSRRRSAVSGDFFFCPSISR